MNLFPPLLLRLNSCARICEPPWQESCDAHQRSFGPFITPGHKASPACNISCIVNPPCRFLGSMKRCFALAAILFLIIHNAAEGLRQTPNAVMPSRSSAAGDHEKDDVNSEEGAYEDVRIPYGSSLPDCSHACGPCSPCQRVMVSFECSVAESCPIVYKCMCKGRYYHVPSS